MAVPSVSTKHLSVAQAAVVVDSEVDVVVVEAILEVVVTKVVVESAATVVAEEVVVVTPEAVAVDTREVRVAATKVAAVEVATLEVVVVATATSSKEAAVVDAGKFRVLCKISLSDRCAQLTYEKEDRKRLLWNCSISLCCELKGVMIMIPQSLLMGIN